MTISLSADLRLGKQIGGLFHPKFYRFCLPGKTLGWVGSANLTGPAFAANCELVLEFEAGDADRLWFEEVWRAGVKASKEIIDAYEQSWVEPPAAMTGETAKPVAKIDTPFDLIAHGVLNWANYHRALLQADQWWLFRTDGQFGVLPGTSSWVETLRAASTIMLRDWERLSQLEYQILLGLKVQNKFDYGLLGSMSGAGYAKNIFHVPTPENVAKRRIFQRCTQDVITAPLNQTFPHVARDRLEELMSMDGIAMAVSTRFLALARPEALISVNGQSRQALSKLSGISQARLSTPTGYEELTRWVMDQPWWSDGPPSIGSQLELWSMRAALIDSFVYNGQHFEDAAQ